MNLRTCLHAVSSVLIAIALFAAPVSAGVIDDDWIVFEDFVTGAECGVINAWNAELIALFGDGQMVIVSGADTELFGLEVTSDDEVLWQGDSAGFIEFLDDGDDLPAVFWTTLVGTLVEVDTLTGEPFDSGMLPSQRFSTDCDACDQLIDDDTLCGDAPIDGGIDNGGGNIPGDLFFPFPVFCGAGSPAIIMLAMLAVPLTKRTRARRRR